MKKVCVERMIAFGQAGNAGKIKIKTLSQMVSFYNPPKKAAKKSTKKAIRKKAKKAGRKAAKKTRKSRK